MLAPLSLSAEGVCVDSVRADVDLIQTEWDVCARELQAASERVNAQGRVSAVSAELADLDGALGEQDQWLVSTSAAEKCDDEAELRHQSGECQVSNIVPICIHLDHNFPPIPGKFISLVLKILFYNVREGRAMKAKLGCSKYKRS